MRTRDKRHGFTLMELLAAVALMTVLGTMLFRMFDDSSRVVRESNARQLLFQQARLLFSYLEREATGACVTPGLRPFNANNQAGAFDTLTLTSTMLGRDTHSGSASFGLESNLARVGYFVSDRDHTLYRYEYYDLYGAGGETTTWEDSTRSFLVQVGGSTVTRATPFVINVVGFKVECFDNGTFQLLDWDSGTRPAGTSPLPKALRITLRLTDAAHLAAYNGTDDDGDGLIDERDETDDNVGEAFHHVIYLGSVSQ